MWPGDAMPVAQGRVEVSAEFFKDKFSLGSRVETSTKSANRGHVLTVQFKGQCYLAAGT